MNEPEPEPGCFGCGRGLGRVHGINATERRHDYESRLSTRHFKYRPSLNCSDTG